MRWQIRLVRSFVAANAPGYDALRRWKRRRSGYAPNLSNLGSTIGSVRAQVALMQSNGLSLEGRVVLEVGSGWFPVAPLLYRCLGARRVVMTDIRRHMDNDTLETARRFVLDNLTALSDKLGLDADQPWLDRGRTFDDLGLTYLAPFDPANDEIRTDVIASRTVLEHIPPEELERVAGAWHSILAPGGFMVHSVDHSDHREHSDKRLSRIDFLTYSEAGWDRITRLGVKQWRLRHSDYHRIFAGAWDLVDETTYADPRALEDARTLPLKPPFDSYDPEELGIVASHYLLRPSGLHLAAAANLAAPAATSLEALDRDSVHDGPVRSGGEVAEAVPLAGRHHT